MHGSSAIHFRNYCSEYYQNIVTSIFYAIGSRHRRNIIHANRSVVNYSFYCIFFFSIIIIPSVNGPTADSPTVDVSRRQHQTLAFSPTRRSKFGSSLYSIISIRYVIATNNDGYTFQKKKNRQSQHSCLLECVDLHLKKDLN